MLAGEVGPRGATEAAQTAETAAAALDVLRRSISVDVHSHGGSTGITSKAPPNGDLATAMWRDFSDGRIRPRRGLAMR
jgi:membrane dipeptidase